jgi:hypothetical protein
MQQYQQASPTLISEHTFPSEPVDRAVATAAYYRAERRGFSPGRELDDWLEAEREISSGKYGEV